MARYRQVFLVELDTDDERGIEETQKAVFKVLEAATRTPVARTIPPERFTVVSVEWQHEIIQPS